MRSKRLLTVVALAVLVSACVDEPEPLEPPGADAEIHPGDVPATDETGTGDTTADDSAPDLGGETAGAAPTCAEALECLVAKKEWTPGSSFPEGDCTDGMAQEQTVETDALLACMSAQCQPQYDAWRNAGPGGSELGLLYGCLINGCAKAISVCAGGQGTGNCGQALWCLNDCANPTDQECNLACLADTDDYQSGKTGDFLECIFGECPFTSNFSYDCVFEAASAKCIGFCFEAASGP